ncbi:MAG: segregation and condensation protein A [Chitinophagales bacterium]
MATYQVKLPQFEGPFDLLLYFIERSELDIHDIAIAQLTDDFLAYLLEMELLNIELASEFMLVAATLMRIKAKMLLPRQELNEAGEVIDPRAELVQKLLEYKQFKEVVTDLKLLEAQRLKQFKRGNTKKELQNIAGKYQVDAELESLDLFRLMNVFNKVLSRLEERKNKVQFSIVRYPYTIQTERKTIKEQLELARGEKMVFTQIFDTCKHRIQAVFRFLAILELNQANILNIKTGTGINNFWIISGKTKEDGDTVIMMPT